MGRLYDDPRNQILASDYGLSLMADAFIEVYEGLLGGGKTYSVVLRLFKAVVDGRTIITNIGIKWENWKKEARERYGVELEDDQYIKLTPENVGSFDKFVKRGTRQTPVIMALDEIHLFFNARDWNHTNKNCRNILELLTQARKINLHLILITQSRHNLDKQFVRMVQYFWRCKDMQKWDIPIGPLKLRYPLPQIFQGCVQAENEKVFVRKKFIPKEKWVFSLYETCDLAKNLDIGDDVVDKKQLKKVKSNAPWWRWPALLFFVVGVSALVVGCVHVFGSDDLPESSSSPDPQNTLSQTSDSQPPAETASEASPALRLKGIYSLGSEVCVLFDGHDWFRLPAKDVTFTKDGMIWDGEHYPYEKPREIALSPGSTNGPNDVAGGPGQTDGRGDPAGHR